jgi:hypothetical protein
MSADASAPFEVPFVLATPAETIAGFVGLTRLSDGSAGGASSECKPLVAGTSSESIVDLPLQLVPCAWLADGKKLTLISCLGPAPLPLLLLRLRWLPKSSA